MQLLKVYKDVESVLAERLGKVSVLTESLRGARIFVTVLGRLKAEISNIARHKEAVHTCPELFSLIKGHMADVLLARVYRASALSSDVRSYRVP